ncbi:recombinase family protein [Mesorhizobium sp.]|uniref:recombinase family protein n=1 Tax=Mesorhizobium sp. TaxID=1871066 RepID=UPI000FE3BC06|nr:recombinase family protein [Mesorhizobium sp.]RWN48066.1 MAG: recombinase family protein [Mesorhizobium sp.]RWN66679.1 MAG: recombinase family protein [Mesorhizobium sp.]RWN67781.1 MAG: recombinase family protein [Mesorhizobium sp.]RWN76814.1 MAG: recombinase family protein [Mesorhizobium sp.]RWO04409.1 MAG: recombinase family protein [Mesorhizobium sp.]
MLAIPSSSDERLTTVRRSKFAYVYVRQSSINQVRHHQESTELQYSLVDRAVRLGWPPDRVVVIDEDLGKSGNGQVERGGFQRLIAEIGLGNAGLVVSLDASRLARNNRDWHQLLELCSLFGVIIADGERLYDPCAYHDRLLLGLSGIMSEAELHQIRIRLHQGERQKAARGELRIPLPGGLTYNRSGQIVFNPDEEVQARLRLIFDKFRELGTARRVMRYLRTHDLRVPVRPLRGPAPHELVWRDATIAHVHHILHNPAYAGAYVYGRRRINAVRQGPGSDRATSKVAIDDWEVCIKDAHPGYINWEEFMANQRRLANNTNRYEAGHRGAPRKGIALLQGLAVCGQCGRRMTVRYSGPDSACPVYCCLADRNQTGSSLCQEVRAPAVDELVAQTLLKALEPDQIAIAIAALDEIAEETRSLEKQWALRRERARYDAERARRQYDTVEPENRLVARTLEKAWEDKLRLVDEIEQEYHRWRDREPLVLQAQDHAALQELAENLPAIWHSETTQPEDRKRILRFIVQEVVLDQKKIRGQVAIRILWQTGATSEHQIQRRVQSYDRDYGELELVRERITQLNAAGDMDRQIAKILNEEGVRSARGKLFSYENIWLLRHRWGIPTAKINGVAANPPRWPDGTYSVQGAAAAIGVTAQTIFDYLAQGLVHGRQSTKGQPWQISLSSDQIDQLQSRLQRTRRSRKGAS